MYPVITASRTMAESLGCRRSCSRLFRINLCFRRCHYRRDVMQLRRSAGETPQEKRRKNKMPEERFKDVAGGGSGQLNDEPG